MHEFSLYGEVPGTEHKRMLQQLAGVTRMQPQPLQEIHLVFKSQVPPALQAGIANTTSSSDKQSETQRTIRMLNTGLYYVQVIGRVVTSGDAKRVGEAPDGDVEMTNGEASTAVSSRQIRWRLDFKNTPEPGKQTTSVRFVSRISIEDGDVIQFMRRLGYDYVSRYLIDGSQFYDRDSTLFLHRVLRIPDAETAEVAIDCGFLDKPDTMQPLDSKGGHLLQVSILAGEGNNQDLKERATTQLLAMKETLRLAVNLTPGDRLALDSRIPAAFRR